MSASSTSSVDYSIKTTPPVSLASATDLRLAGTGISAEVAVNLAKQLQEAMSLAYLDLSMNPIGDIGLKAVARALHGKPHLHTLLLHNVNVTSDSIEDLAAAIQSLPKFQGLRFCSNKVGDEGLKVFFRALYGKDLIGLQLGETGITDEVMPELCAAISKMPRLGTLALQGNFITDEGFAQLREALAGKEIRTLYIYSNKGSGACLFTPMPSSAESVSSSDDELTDNEESSIEENAFVEAGEADVEPSSTPLREPSPPQPQDEV